MYRKYIILIICIFNVLCTEAQQNIVSYIGNSNRETLYDVTELSNGTFLVCGYTESLSWINPSVPLTQLSYTGTIPNSLGLNRFGFIMQLSNNMQQILQVVHFPQGVVEDIRFIKTNSKPYTSTGDLFISCNTSDNDANNGGYILAKLNNNFVNGTPNSLSWFMPVWAKSYAKTYHPWDVTSKGEVYYVSGEAHGYDWSALYCLNPQGKRKIVQNWRTHWLKNGTEWKGTPASSNPFNTLDSVNYSGIALKLGGRCELRSWTASDFNLVSSDGNGGTRKGKWPADFLFNSPCDPQNPTANSPGYNGYSPEACCPVWGASCIAVDRRTNILYVGMNFKSYYNPTPSPDFEPAVISFDSLGTLRWWSRLYHEITPQGDTVGSIPDQYVDALAIDYTNSRLIVAARAHGNNTENLWEGNTIALNPNAQGFQNQFTGTNGNIHESWLGALNLSDGSITASTFVAELAEGTGGLGTPHADPNLDGWPDPNTGWPDVNTTYIGKNNIKVSSNGDVCILGVGRRTITTKNAYQKMVKPTWGGKSCWNSFVRVYDKNLRYPKYSSLVVGQWDTLTQAGGDNTELFGIFKTSKGVIAVGRQKADANNASIGNMIPVVNLPSWGNAAPNGESGIFVYYVSDSLTNVNDQPLSVEERISQLALGIYPNPVTQNLYLKNATNNLSFDYGIYDITGRLLLSGKDAKSKVINVSALQAGVYLFVVNMDSKYQQFKFVKL